MTDRDKWFKCNGCGKCCLSAGALPATAEDYQMWLDAGEKGQRIIETAMVITPVVIDIWVDPETGEDVDRCPWLRKRPPERGARLGLYYCSIYELRPAVCREYPQTPIHAVSFVDCEGVTIPETEFALHPADEPDPAASDLPHKPSAETRQPRP
jgi:Fe-S-cluster containining protein